MDFVAFKVSDFLADALSLANKKYNTKNENRLEDMKRLRVLLMAAFLTVMAMSFTSCEEVEIRYGNVEGVWELESDQYGYVRDLDVDKYRFNYNGTGVYGCYDSYGHWVADIPFVWDYGWNGDGTILIDFGSNGGVYRYYYDFDGGYLMLSKDPSFRTYLAYRRVPN